MLKILVRCFSGRQPSVFGLLHKVMLNKMKYAFQCQKLKIFKLRGMTYYFSEKESNFEKQTNKPKEPWSNGYRRPLRRDSCLSFGGPRFDSP